MTAPAVPRVLLVDDHATDAARLGARLHAELAAEVVAVADAGEAAARLRSEPFDCVLVDADRAGDDALAALQAAAPHVSCVLVSSAEDADLALAVVRHGVQDAVHKADAGLGAAVGAATSRTRAQLALRRATERLGAVLDQAPDHVFVKDLEGRYVFVNAAWSRTTGVLPDDALGRADGDLFGPAVARRHAETDRRAAASPSPVRFESRRGGRTFAVVKFPLRDDAGTPVGICGIASDMQRVVEARAELEAERARHELVLHNLPDTAVVLLDRWLHVMVVEGELARRRGQDPTSLFGRHVTEAWPAMNPLEDHLDVVLTGVEQRFDLVAPDGLRAEVHAVPQLDAERAVEGILVVVRDVTAAHRATAAREEAETLFRSAFDNSPIGMAITGLDGSYEIVNRALLEILGEASLEGRRWQEFTHPDDRSADEAAAAESLATGTGLYRREKRYLHADGHEVWVEVSATPLRAADGRAHRWFAQVVDITERKRFEERLERIAHHDALTGLLNRRGFERALADHLARLRRYGGGGALVVLDLDAFKVVNDTLGHRAGDQLVVSAATALAARLRGTDVLARLGGDEFAVLLPHADAARAALVAKELVDAVRGGAAVVAGGRRRGVTASAGVVLLEDETRTGESLLAEADLAMYDAKEAGRDRVCVAGAVPPAAGVQMRDRVAWLERLQAALEDELFVLHAQPVYDLDTGTVHHHELLIRLPDGEGRLIPPGTFLPIAERAGLIAELDRWVLRTALRVLAEQRAAGRPRRFSVNLSGRSIGDEAVLAEIEAGLRRPGADPADLLVELTETAAVADEAGAHVFLSRLRELGFVLSLDDFGVGFGSLYELKHLPCDEVKLDGEFVRGCATSETDRVFIVALVDLARRLGKRIVAEFVHDDATAIAVRDLGVQLGQGFHLGRPLPLAEVLSAPASAAAA